LNIGRSESSDRRRVWPPIVFLFVAFAIANAVNALRKGGDFQVYLETGRRLLAAAPLYDGSSPGLGVTGTPLLASLFIPLALLDAQSPVAARIAWYAAGLIFLWFGVKCWSRSIDTSGSFACVGFALVCVIFPLQTNFEHQNLNPLLLFLLGYAALAFSRDRHAMGGAAIGAAAALKVFPALLIVYLAYRRRWAALAAAVGAGVALTLFPMLRYGRGAAEQFTAWWGISSGGWPTRSNNQSLVAAVDRAVTGFEEPHVTVSDNLLTPIVTALLAAALIIAFVIATRRSRPAVMISREMATVTVLAVLLSPIAWDHYWVLLFPAFLVAFTDTSGQRWSRVPVWIAGGLTSALTPLTLGRPLFDTVRERSPHTIAALILFVVLVMLLHNSVSATAQPEPIGGQRLA
jgi:alpha-1,2-mannosyltransferase